MTNPSDTHEAEQRKTLKDASAMTTEQAVESAKLFIASHFKLSGVKAPRISIPADLEKDDDLRLIAHIERVGAQLARVTEERDTMKKVVEAVRNHLDCYNVSSLRNLRFVMHYFIEWAKGRAGT